MPDGRRFHPLPDTWYPDSLADPPCHHTHVHPTSQVLHTPHRNFYIVRHHLCPVSSYVRLPRKRRLALRQRKEETETQTPLRNRTSKTLLGERVLSGLPNSVRAGKSGVSIN